MLNFSTFFFVFGLYAVIASEFSVKAASRRPRVIGAPPTEYSNEFLYTVKIVNEIYYTNDTTSGCSGAILDNNHVITAAHCFVKKAHWPPLWKEGSFLVIAGATDIYDTYNNKTVIVGVQKVYTPKIFTNPKTRYPTEGDIAVLKLETPLNLSQHPHLSAVQLLKNDNFTYNEKTAVFSGYGQNKGKIFNNGSMWIGLSDGKLRNVKLRVLDHNLCRYLRGNDELICGEVMKDKFEGNPCYGDSGGPLIYSEKILIGLLNVALTTPFNCNDYRLPTVYVRVSVYEKFIQKILKCRDDILNKDPEILVNKLTSSKIWPKENCESKEKKK